MDRIEVILATEISNHSDGQMDIREFNHEITFDHVGFTYANAEKPALKNISFSVKKVKK